PAEEREVVDGARVAGGPLGTERRQLERPEVAVERTAEPPFEIVWLDRREEADAAVVHADHRRAAARLAGEGAQHAAVAAHDDDQVLAARLELDAIRAADALERRVLAHLALPHHHLHP